MYIYYIKKHILNIKNIILFIILLFISIIMISSISIGVTFIDLKNNLINNNLRFRTLIVNENEDNYKKLEKINHIIAIEDTIYQNPLEYETNEFDRDLKGKVLLSSLLEENGLVISNGKMINNENEAICSDVFFPYETEEENGKIKFDKNKVINGKDIIGTSFKITSDDNKIYEFKIVGTYDSLKNNSSLNNCYIKKEIFFKIAPKNNGGISQYDEDLGEYVFIPNEYQGKLLIVDNYKNIKKVEEELVKLGFSFYPSSELNDGYVKLLTYVPIFTSIIISLILLIILESFLSKKIQYKSKDNAILKSIGYSNNVIKRIDLIENVIIYGLSFIISNLIYIIIFNYFKNIYFAEYIYDGVILQFSILPIIISFILMFSILYYVNKKVQNKKLDKSISEIFYEIFNIFKRIIL